MRNNRFFIIKQFSKFGLVGVTNTLVDFSTYFLLTRTFVFWLRHYLWTNFFSFLVAVTWSFIFNRNWTFRNNGGQLRKKYIKFFIINVVGLGINQTILFTLVQYFSVYDLLAKLIAVLIVLFWSFTLSKYWAFKTQ